MANRPEDVQDGPEDIATLLEQTFSGTVDLRALGLLRAIKGLSLKKAAELSGTSAAYMQKLENGEVVSPSPHKLHDIAEAYNYPYRSIMAMAGYIHPDESVSSASKPAEHVSALMEAIGDGLSSDEANWVAISLRELRQLKAQGIEPPIEFLFKALRVYVNEHNRTQEVQNPHTGT